MKICVISTNIMTCPPKGYSGLEMLAWQQAEGLKAKKHDVTLIAPRGSITNCHLHETTLGESEDKSFGGYMDKLPTFDVIIDNSWHKFSYLYKRDGKLKSPILGVCHAPIETMYNTPPPVDKPCLIGISQDQAEAIKSRLQRHTEVSYNGVDMDMYKPNGTKRNNRYLFLARFSTIKGPDIAIAAAKAAGVGLDLVGDDTLTGEVALLGQIFNECGLNPAFRYVGAQRRTQCIEWFNRNLALLHPNERFREPFGLAPVEAMACGMPVIAWDNGAMRETVKHGETGFLVKSVEEIISLIKTNSVSGIKAKRCREWANQFSIQNMVNRYEELCQKAITNPW